MEQPPIQPAKTQNAPFTPAVNATWSFKNIATGVFIGILIGIAGVIFYQGYLPEITQALYTATWVIFGLVIITFVLFWGLKSYLIRYVFGTKTANAGDVLEDAQKISDVITERLADRLLTDLPVEDRGRVKKVLPRLTNWFFWSRLRNWWWQWILGIFVSLGGITGTMLLMNQNKLLESQNQLIQRQMSLEEASRRSALVMLMSNIMDKVDREIEEQKRINPKDTVFSLSQSLVGQIAALSHSFKPYRYLNGDTLISKPLSPERGQLLITLTRLPLDSITFTNIYSVSTFEEADLQKANLSMAYLQGADLSRAGLRWSDLTGADLTGADLTGADLSKADAKWASLVRADFTGGANLSEIILWRADLSRANLWAADLSGAVLRNANLKGANLWRANLQRTNLMEANLSEANLRGEDFSITYLEGADLSKADLSEAVLSISQLKDVASLYSCKGLKDSIKTILIKTHPQLFEKPKG